MLKDIHLIRKDEDTPDGSSTRIKLDSLGEE